MGKKGQRDSRWRLQGSGTADARGSGRAVLRGAFRRRCVPVRIPRTRLYSSALYRGVLPVLVRTSLYPKSVHRAGLPRNQILATAFLVQKGWKRRSWYCLRYEVPRECGVSDRVLRAETRRCRRGPTPTCGPSSRFTG
eukprot:3685425-Rhodomonas_salina.2